MMKLKSFLAITLVGVTAFAFAESVAPVYDADNDNDSSQFESQDGAEPMSQPGHPIIQSYSSAAPPTLSQKVARLEQQLANVQNSDSAQHVSQLQNEVQTLRGQIEELTHQLQQAQTQQRAQYADLDKRLNSQPVATPVEAKRVAEPPAMKPVVATKSIPAKKEKMMVAKAVVPVASPDASAQEANDDSQPNVAEEQQIYQAAYNYIKSRKYNEAVGALQGMLQKYPSGQFAANAHYWLGELYGLMSKSDQSAVEFSTVLKRFPDSPKVSDAQLKLGLIYSAESKWSEARSAFKTVINKYPGTASAHAALEQLKQLKEAGH